MEIGNFDLFHYPYFDIFSYSSQKKNIPTVVTVHDLTPLVSEHYRREYGKISVAQKET